MSSGEFQKENREKHKKRKRGVNLVKKGGALGIFLAKQLARLGELGGKHLPQFLKKMVLGPP